MLCGNQISATARPGAVILCALILTACAATGNYTYKLYPGPELPDSELATVTFGSRLEHVFFDGLSVHRSDYGDIRVRPGEHAIIFDALWGARDIHVTVDLEKGRRYLLLQTDVWPFCCPEPAVVSGEKVWAWIQEEDTGVVIGELVQTAMPEP